MKWYTYKERKPNPFEQGLFYIKYGGSLLMETAMEFRGELNILDGYKGIKVEDIVYWIPMDELKETLPRDKE